MSQKDNTSEVVSLKPSTMEDAAVQQPLDLDSKRALNAIHKMTFDEFVATYAAPVPEWDDYLDLRNAPDIWDECMLHLPRSHVFLYAHCLISACPDLNGWAQARLDAKDQCRETGNEAGLLWLNMRPKFTMSMSVSGGRRRFPVWDKKVRGWFVSAAANDYKVTARLLLIVYGCKIVLSSDRADLGAWRPLLEREARRWDDWVKTEKDEIRRFFSLV